MKRRTKYELRVCAIIADDFGAAQKFVKYEHSHKGY
jgi:hypothetical protein